MSAGGRTLFTRQSSGLVREVSVVNALFFNTSAFIGGTLGGAFQIAVLAGVPVVVVGGLTNWSWVAFIVGGMCILLAFIFASLTSVMPRSGGDYVFSSRIVPRVGPFLGWLESWGLVFASIALLQFETVQTLRSTQVEGRIIGIGTGSDFFNNANSWFTDGTTGAVTGIPGFIAALVVFAAVAWVVLQPTRRFHKIVTYLTILGVAGWALTAVCGLLFFDPAAFAANLPTYANGITVDQLTKAGADAGLTSGFDFGPTNATSWPLMLMAGVMLFQFIGFQYSAYISGEVRGNVKRGILIAVLAALGMAVLMNSIYAETLGRRLGLDAQTAWSALWWGYIDPAKAGIALPMGSPNYFQLMGAVAHPELWPIWTVVGAASTLFPFLLMPVYVIFISRIALAWSLDRQVPEWFGVVSERLRAPANAIFATLAIGVVFLILWAFPVLKWVGLGFLAPELGSGAGRQAEPGRLGLVHDPRLLAQLDHAGGQRAAGALHQEGPGERRPVHPVAAVPRGDLAGLHPDPLLVRRDRADLQHDLRRHGSAGIPEQLRRQLRRHHVRRRRRLVHRQVHHQPSGRHPDGAHVPVAAARLIRAAPRGRAGTSPALLRAHPPSQTLPLEPMR